MNIFGGLVTQLRSVIVLTNTNIMDLRWYISNRYSDLSPKEAAKIFAEAVNKIIDKNIPEIGEPLKQQIKTILFENAIKEPEFEINCADVFTVCLKERSFPISGFRDLSTWIKQYTNEPVSVDKLRDLYEGVQAMLLSHPQDDIEEIIKVFENKNDGYNPFSKMQVALDNYSDSYGSNQSQNNYGSNQSQNNYGSSQSQSNYGSNQPQKNYEYISYNDSKKSKSKDVELTYVNYNEFKPIYSFNNPSSLNNDQKSKKKLSTFMKKVTMRNMVMVSATAAAAFIFAKSAGYTTDISDGLSSRSPESGVMPLSSENTKYVDSTMNLVLQTYKTVDSKVEMPTTDQQTKELQVINVSTSGVEKTSNASPNQYITNSIKTISAKATSYTLSVASCGKARTDPEYGITFSGTHATAGRTCAVDPKVIPIGSQLYIVFPKAYSHLDGVYIAEDTGRLIKGNIVDIFLGEDAVGSMKVEKECDKFGVQRIQVYLLKDKANLAKLS